MNIKECSVLGFYNLLKFFLLLALANLIDYALKCILSSLGCTELFYLIILFVITFAIVISIIFTMEQAVAIIVYLVVCFILTVEVNKITYEEALDERTGKLRMGFYCCNVKYLVGVYSALDKWKQDMECCENDEFHRWTIKTNSNGFFQVGCFERLNFYADMRVFIFGASFLFTFLSMRCIKNLFESHFGLDQDSSSDSEITSEIYELTVKIPIDKSEVVL
ncbi:unnamed protein product [Diamesa tonsa]